MALIPFLTSSILRRISPPISFHKLLSHVKETWHVNIDGVDILLTGTVFGGPVTATVIEELAELDVRIVIGYGFSGGLVSNIEPGMLVIADQALNSSGTAKSYNNSSVITADKRLVALSRATFEEAGIIPTMVTSWTTDAIYREYPTVVKHWRDAGAQIVNMETDALYAVAKACGIATVYVTCVSDSLASQTWSGWNASKRPLLEEISLKLCLLSSREILL